MNQRVRSLFQNALRNLFHANLPKPSTRAHKVYLKYCICHQRPTYRSNHVLAAISFVKILQFMGLSDGKDPEIKELLGRAKELLQIGKVEEASKLYNEVLVMAVNSEDSESVYYIKKKLAVIAFISKQYGEAEKLFLEVRDYHVQKGVPDNDLRIMSTDLRLAETYDNMGAYEKADQRYKICARNLKPQISSSEDAELKEFWLHFLSSRGRHLLRRGNFEKAVKYFAKAYNTCLQIKGEMNEQTVVLLQLLGSAYYQKGEVENAIIYLRKASDLGKHFPGYIELSNTYVSLGNILLKQGLVEEGKYWCDMGLKNATRHKYEQGIKESNACLKEFIGATS